MLLPLLLLVLQAARRTAQRQLLGLYSLHVLQLCENPNAVLLLLLLLLQAARCTEKRRLLGY
jgi:hypothetical protein